MKLVLVVQRQDFEHVIRVRFICTSRLEETNHLVPRIRGDVRKRQLHSLTRRGRGRGKQGVHVVRYARQQERMHADEVLLAADDDFEIGLAELVQPPRQERWEDGSLVGSLRFLFFVGHH